MYSGYHVEKKLTHSQMVAVNKLVTHTTICSDVVHDTLLEMRSLVVFLRLAANKINSLTIKALLNMNAAYNKYQCNNM